MIDKQIKEMLWAIPQFEKLEDYELAAELEKAIKQLITEHAEAELEKILKNSSGGGNWRRQIVLRVEELKKGLK